MPLAVVKGETSGMSSSNQEVIHTISSPSGKVLRIVIFKKTGVQAMVEFDSIEAAKRAKESLNGADIYSGCCTLKIEYAKDFWLGWGRPGGPGGAPAFGFFPTPSTTSGKGDKMSNRPPPLLQEPRLGAGPQPYRAENIRNPPGVGYGGTDRYEDFHGGGVDYPDPYSGDRFPGASSERFKREYVRDGGLPSGMTNRTHGYRGAPPTAAPTPLTGPVMMVYGLDTKKLNCDRLFNLFCLYGNVARIKFLKTKEGAAMIQMGDGLAVERCVQHLNNAPMFDSKNRLQLGYSKQLFLSDVTNPFVLPDGSSSFKDYVGNKHNRFVNPTMSLKNRIQSPSRILHFFNTPPTISEENLLALFAERKITPPTTVKIFPMKSERSSSGLLEFEDVEGAIEALVVLNHVPVDNPNGKFPYTMKLCFSSSRQVNVNGSGRLQEGEGGDN